VSPPGAKVLAGLFVLYVQRKRKERRRNNHCKCDLVTIGVDHCPGSAAYLALSTETISDEGRRAWDI
jgi:hypothetical protein